jgi:hypothetical protein
MDWVTAVFTYHWTNWQDSAYIPNLWIQFILGLCGNYQKPLTYTDGFKMKYMDFFYTTYSVTFCLKMNFV